MPGEPEEGLLGAEFELSRLLRTFRSAQKVVVRPPPTEVSNLNAPSCERRRGTGRGNGIRVHGVPCASCMCNVLDDMQACMVVPTRLRSFIGLRSMCHRAAATPAHLIVLLGCAQRGCCKRQI